LQRTETKQATIYKANPNFGFVTKLLIADDS